MADIFISYSSKDQAKAFELAKWLSKNGYECWIDKSDIVGAEAWTKEIVGAIESCTTFIILLSRNAIASHNVVKELSLASEGRKHIIPILLEPVEFTDDVKYQLAGLHCISYKDVSRIENALRSVVRIPSQLSPKKILLTGSYLVRRYYRRNALFASFLIMLCAAVFFFVRKDDALPEMTVPTKDTVAYNLYVQSLEFYDHHTDDDFHTALDLINRAIARDPNFPQAHQLKVLLLNEFTKLEKENYDRAVHKMPNFREDN